MTAPRSARTFWLLGLLAVFTPATALGQAALQRLERQIAQPGVPPAAPPVVSAQPEPPKADDLPPAPGAEPGYLGIIAVDHDTQGRGVRLVDVLAGGPAALGGLKIGDLITSIDGTAVADRGAMAEVMKDRVAGEEVTFVVLRDGEVARLDVMLSKRPPPEERRFANFGTIGVDTTAIGGAPLPAPANAAAVQAARSPQAPLPPQPNMPSLPAPAASSTAALPSPQLASVSPAPVKVPENSLPTPKTPATDLPSTTPPSVVLPAPVVVPQPNIDVGGGSPNGPLATAARTGMLGIRTARVTPELQLAMNLPEPRGALVVEVRPGSPANMVGIPVEAVIVAVDAERVNSPDDLLAAVRERGPGAEVRLSYYRYGQLYERLVKLEAPVELPPAVAVPSTSGPAIGGPAMIAPSTVGPAVDPEAELRREVSELERRLADLKRQLDAKSPPADKKN